MRTAIVVTALALGGAAPVISPEMVDEINARPGITWKAAHNARFAGMSEADAKRMMGTIRRSPLAKAAKAKHSAWDLTAAPLSSLPGSFDVRTAFPWASNITTIVRDQSSCGSCWAFGSTEAFNDRLAIGRNFTAVLSAADTMSCCGGFTCLGSSGCDGGMPDEAWSFFASTGVVTGAGNDATTNIGCEPYPFEVCAHHVVEPGIPACPTNEFVAPQCPSACPNSAYSTPYASDKHVAASSYNLGDVPSAMTDLVTRGTLTVSFDVYQDFLTYQSGVYTCPSSGQPLGGHSVSIIGYGTDSTSGMDYWVVRNSWNSGWGNGGTFYIRRGTDECGIEDDIVAGAV